jgi:DUSP domain
LDWISILGLAMIPYHHQHSTTTTPSKALIPSDTSIQKYLNVMYSTKPPLCQIYQLTESRLYEIKRRFHSLVQQQQSPAMMNAAATTTTTALDSNSLNASLTSLQQEASTNNATTAAAMEPSSTNGNNNNNNSNYRQHVITPISFCYGVSGMNPKDEVYGDSSGANGGTGYIPLSMAKLLFRVGYYYNTTYGSTRMKHGEGGDGDTTVNTMALLHSHGGTMENIGWTLYHVLHFGCIALRLDTSTSNQPIATGVPNGMDEPLLRFIFTMFLFDDSDNMNEQDVEGGRESYIVDDPAMTSCLSRKQVTNMILHLIEHAEFRRRIDSPPMDVDDDENNYGNNTKMEMSRREDQNVSLATVVSLALVDPPEGSKPSDLIWLKTVIDHILDNVSKAIPNHMTFYEFCVWNTYGTRESSNGSDVLQQSSSTLDASHRSTNSNTSTSPGTVKKRRNTIGRGRLHPLMMDLRLIAGVKFGIPPTLASMEVSLIAEIERRHLRRYPTSDVSRRGPRGTVWNVIDAPWFKSWATHVQSVEGTEEDALDGRGDPHSDRVRGLFRISNTGLLIENGSLSLRKEIRWKIEYELIAPLAWSALQAWYDGGPPIQRSVVKYLPNSGVTASPHSPTRAPLPTENEIELHPYFATVYLCDVTSRGIARPFQQNYPMSCVSPILVLLVQLCKELDVSPDAARLWVIGSTKSGAASDSQDVGKSDDWILNTEMNIVDQRKRRGVSNEERVVLLLELKDKDTGLWPRGIDGKQWSFRDGATPAPIPTDLGDGIVGLYNMGYVYEPTLRL